MVINYSSEFSWKAQKKKEGGREAHGERRRSTQTGTKACHEGSCLPLLQTHILPWLCRQRLGPPRQISPGGYYRPEDEMIFRQRSFHAHTDAQGLILKKITLQGCSLYFFYFFYCNCQLRRRTKVLIHRYFGHMSRQIYSKKLHPAKKNNIWQMCFMWYQKDVCFY